MTLQHSDWSYVELVDLYTEDGTVEENIAHGLANDFIKWVNVLLPQQAALTGWSYDARTGTFTGPANPDVLNVVMTLVVDAGDIVSQA
jgi:hypothetical protein